MAELFAIGHDNIGLRLNNIETDDELGHEATTEESSVVQIEGEREVRRPLNLYNLDAILAVGYRVRSPAHFVSKLWRYLRNKRICREWIHDNRLCLSQKANCEQQQVLK